MKLHILGLILCSCLSACTKTECSIVVIDTPLGSVELEIYEHKAPITAKHFLYNIDNNIFTKACFYRVVHMDNQEGQEIKIEVIQAGLFHDSIVDQMPCIEHERTDQTGILHKDGVISMARNQPSTACTEFFICVGDQPHLDAGGLRNSDSQGFAAFGKVIKGMDLVRKIQKQKEEGQMLIDRIPIISIKRK
ncbi:peptidylprolyl isomerase [Ancylomarina euxinus]|uniref:peptidylprolyl isomerase n=1 Tax=Ancylomarina euxinus TaxID=2283627 RepID=A0A425Y439_9BACT|nr:peptidylprolyl isomerase [Ancylomarina euxinus]MCZ4694567.1 peptidylprolyl isomerase [Ancylomarina euxinus]MUP14110.1 peptidylprolyl isomerase [Ancylomarina euxinus]RRG22967.1 peptidylprolyl isomerase [Ancylomarina euxinus]